MNSLKIVISPARFGIKGINLPLMASCLFCLIGSNFNLQAQYYYLKKNLAPFFWDEGGEHYPLD